MNQSLVVKKDFGMIVALCIFFAYHLQIMTDCILYLLVAEFVRGDLSLQFNTLVY